ncbi:hypothetical protein VOLCADRAFT_97098 [Volvox carteri f. nagariensis]|uniref:Uncharacterized protein n=1 Tax=Volvox carteri f. nagariensis TaxID=3068 RepID=D8UBW2_VOLCA|nr:uncharacterized protein VOLCADRAFT_97098 [Volvox carteri f. nagariensis]EFJ42840.1 hypothetical protein VOLCADRAFT_97098 [Volvox carteri f. nagariensis]|eukprot:XP_002956100.1 hypothetical protein VOLCADRAFT_97098 [Volvox carteri f. nagariensis]
MDMDLPDSSVRARCDLRQLIFLRDDCSLELPKTFQIDRIPPGNENLCVHHISTLQDPSAMLRRREARAPIVNASNQRSQAHIVFRCCEPGRGLPTGQHVSARRAPQPSAASPSAASPSAASLSAASPSAASLSAASPSAASPSAASPSAASPSAASPSAASLSAASSSTASPSAFGVSTSRFVVPPRAWARTSNRTTCIGATSRRHRRTSPYIAVMCENVRLGHQPVRPSGTERALLMMGPAEVHCWVQFLRT